MRVKLFTSKRYIDGWIFGYILHRYTLHTATGVIILVRNFHCGLENAVNFLPLF